jgi:hypothetical protein
LFVFSRIATDRVRELDALRGDPDEVPFGEKNFNCPERAVRSVVVASCEDDDLRFRDDVDEAVLVVDPP